MSYDLDSFLAIPRLSRTLRSPGGRLVVHADTLSPDRKRFVTALWEVDTARGGARRLTQPRPGTSAAGFLGDGSLLFTAKREDPERPPAGGDDPDADAPSLWLLPAAGGEASRIASAGAGVHSVAVARDAPVVAFLADVFPSAATLADDGARARERRDLATTALWFDAYPIRYWDHFLAPRMPRLFTATVDGTAAVEPRDLTGDAAQALREASLAVTPDGTAVVTTWEVRTGDGDVRRDVAVVDLAAGGRRTLLSRDRVIHGDVAISPDGRWVAAIAEVRGTPETAPDVQLLVVPLAGGEPVRLARGIDRWPHGPVFSDDSSRVIFITDDEGATAVWSAAVASPDEAPMRITRDGAFTDLAPCGDALYALRSRVDSPPEVVRIAGDGASVVTLHSVAPDSRPGRLEEIRATAADGTALRAALVVPRDAAGPSPLVVFIHGGPMGSWNAWAWRWQAQVFAARGYAVLMPDPALSTGYGIEMIRRGWREWGGAPYTDVLALTDAAVARDDIDGERTAVTGGSYGGYLTNWVIGHTDRFRCAVTHASLWSMRSFRGTTDTAADWEDVFGHPRRDRAFYEEWSPETYGDAITTPTLVIHGEQDFRVAVSEGFQLFTDLQRRGVPSALLYIADENHWILKPGNIRVWYETFLAWLDHHLLGRPLEVPQPLR